MNTAPKRTTAQRPGIELMRIIIILLAALAIDGCTQNPQLPAIISPYRIDIQQGNVVTQEMVSKLKVGMTRSQVRFVLGSPLVVDMFHADRWDYIYLLQQQGKPDTRRRVTVIFDGDKMLSLEGDLELIERAQEPAPPAPKAPLATKPATKPAAAKPQTPAAAPGTQPETPAAAKPAAAKPDAGASDAATAAGADATKTDPKADAAAASVKTGTAKADDKKDAPKQRGPLGKLLEKIGL